MGHGSGAGTALVTGASAGIGLALARLLAGDGYRLVLVSRSGETLRGVAAPLRERSGAPVDVIAADLSLPGSAERVVLELARTATEVDVLVNNAGVGVYGEFARTDLESELRMIHLNVVSPTLLTKRLLPGMIRRGRGWILNVSSAAAFQPGPLMAVYYATKAYGLHFSEALAEELKGTGVTVTALCPGPTATGFQAAAGMKGSGLFRKAWTLDAETVARSGYDGMMKGKRVVVPGALFKVLRQSVRIFPRAAVAGIVRRVQKELG